MSCCGQKRSALNQSRQAGSPAVRREPSTQKASKLTGLSGRPGGARASAALRAFLARKAHSGR